MGETLIPNSMKKSYTGVLVLHLVTGEFPTGKALFVLLGKALFVLLEKALFAFLPSPKHPSEAYFSDDSCWR